MNKCLLTKQDGFKKVKASENVEQFHTSSPAAVAVLSRRGG
jgi:hypothetical protein